MGLFDWLSGPEKPLNSKEALALAAISMVAADGVVEPEELGVLSSISSIDAHTVRAALKRFKRLKFNAYSCVDVVTEALDAEQRETVVAILFDIAVSDGHLAGDEQALLESYIRAFGLDEARVEEIGELISTKNSPVFDDTDQEAESARWSPRIALGLACLSMIAADGVIEEEEIGVLRSVHTLNVVNILLALEKFQGLNQEPEGCIAPVTECLNHTQQTTALAIMFDIAMSDGHLDGAEKELLGKYMSAFEVSENRAEQLADIIALKNRPIFG